MPKVKFSLKTENKSFKTPALPFFVFTGFLRLFGTNIDNAINRHQLNQDKVHLNIYSKDIIYFLKESKKIIKNCEPFTMLDVKAKGLCLLVEVK